MLVSQRGAAGVTPRPSPLMIDHYYLQASAIPEREPNVLGAEVTVLFLKRVCAHRQGAAQAGRCPLATQSHQLLHALPHAAEAA